jgi:hypothetical protein
VDRTDDPEGYSDDKNPGQPRETCGNQGEREMKERFHSFVLPQIRKFGQIPARR